MPLEHRPLALGVDTSVQPFPRVWWVNQKRSFRQEREGGYLWAPIRNAQNQTFYYWNNLTRVVPGDTVIHYARGIRAISRATGGAQEARRPGDLPDQWENEGRKVETEYFELDDLTCPGLFGPIET